MPDYLPRREGDRVAWAGRLAGVLVASPGDYGFTAGEAGAFGAQAASAAQAWQVSQSPGTRTATTVRVKDAALKELTEQARSLVRRLRAYLALSEQARVRGARLAAVGLRVPSLSRRALALPASVPSVWLVPTFEGTIRVRVSDPARATSRAKPRGVGRLVVFGQVYSQASGTWSAVRFLRHSTKMDFELDYPAGAAAGDLLAVSVRWCNATGKMSQASTPVQLALPPRYGVRLGGLDGRRAA